MISILIEKNIMLDAILLKLGADFSKKHITNNVINNITNNNIVEKSYDDVSIVTKRFIELFESHGVHRNQIPEFFGSDLELEHILDDQKLEKVVTNNINIQQDIAQIFGVRKEWLQGIDSQIYTLEDFYGDTNEFIKFIDSLIGRDNLSEIHITLLKSINYPNERKCHAVMLIEKPIKKLGEKIIYKHIMIDIQSLRYWRTLNRTLWWIAHLRRKNISTRGVEINFSLLEDIRQGETMFDNLKHLNPWYPIDLTIDPKAFIKEVSYEYRNYGVIHGFKQWLELDEDGKFDTDFGRQHARERFIFVLQRYENQNIIKRYIERQIKKYSKELWFKLYFELCPAL